MSAEVLRRGLRVVLVLVALVALWTALVLLSVRGQLLSARDGLEQARGDADPPAALRELREAEADLERAVSRLGQLGPSVVAAVPLVGRPIDAVDRTAEAALAVVSSTADVLEVVDGPEALLRDGGIDLAALDRVREALERGAEQTAEPVAALVAQSTGGLPAPVGGPVASAQEELAGVPLAFGRAAAAAEALGGVLGADGPRRLLVMLQNNAELRGTGGIVTVFAEATAVDGRVDIGGFRDVEEVADPAEQAVAVDAPGDYVDLWGPFLANTTLWKNTNMSPDVPTTSTVLRNVSARSLPAPPDAVLWFDVPAIAAVLEATGPATLPDGSELTADNAVDTLLSKAYFDAPDDPRGQAQRRAALRAVADAVIGRLLGRDVSGTVLAELAPALADAAAGRHLALWSSDEDEQQRLVAAGLAGDVTAASGDVSSVAVQNLGGGDRDGNKLDYYARRRVSVRAVIGESTAVVEQFVELRNTAPADGLPQYVAGGATPGTTNNLVSLAVPRDADLVELTRGGVRVLAELRSSGDHGVVVDAISLAPGTTVTWRLRYRVPLSDGEYRLNLVPQPLAQDAALEVELKAAGGLVLDAVDAHGPLVRADSDSFSLMGPFDDQLHVGVQAQRPTWSRRALDALRSFWSEPIPLP